MADSTRRKPNSGREPHNRRISWCCSFTVPPASPEISTVHRKSVQNHLKSENRCQSIGKGSSNSVHNSPLSSKSGLSLPSRIHHCRILSPGRVSPIDSDPIVPISIQEIEVNTCVTGTNSLTPSALVTSRGLPEVHSGSKHNAGNGGKEMYDARLSLRGKNGGCLLLEMNSEVLLTNSDVFASLIDEYRKGLGGSVEGKWMCWIKVSDVENLGVFRETIELMFEVDIIKKLVKIGVSRSIDILEVSAVIMFNKGILSALKYLEAVPWTEEEEEKLRSLFTRFKFDDTTAKDIMERLWSPDSTDSEQNLAKQLVWSITSSADANARNELKSLVKGLLGKSSIYDKNDHPDSSNEEMYAACRSCMASLVSVFEEASGTTSAFRDLTGKKDSHRSMIERLSRQVDNINWILEILLDRQMAEEFLDMWAGQLALLKMHKSISPMVRYEVSRVSALLFIAMGTRKMYCTSEARWGLFRSWFGPMLLDFGWLQRCRKGLEMKVLEDAMGQTLLTLPLKQQHVLFMEWFTCFSKNGTECPNLSKAFQIWWRRSFLRGSETNAIYSS